MQRTRPTIAPTLALLVPLLVLLLGAHAFAQTNPYENAAFDVRIEVPSGWTASENVDASGLLTLELYPPSGGGVVVVAVASITAADREYWSLPRGQLVDDVWDGFQPEVPGAQIQEIYETEVNGLVADVIVYASEQVLGNVVLIVGPLAVYTLVSASDRANLETVQNGLSSVLGSLVVPSVVRGAPDLDDRTPTPPLPPITQDAPPNPLDPPPPANPLDPAPPTNPLAQGAASDASSVVDPYVGTFADAQVELVLAPSGDGYAGELVIQGTSYPATASLVDGRLDGRFQAGGGTYAFEARLEGDTVTLDSDGSRFVLQRRQ